MTEHACEQCAGRDGRRFDIPITMAFQPIVDVETHTVFAYEALVRGRNGETSGEVLGRVTEETRYHFDQLCRVTAIELAARLGLVGRVSLNFLPNAVYEPANCIRKTLDAADRHGFDCRNIIFELTEQEMIRDPAHLKRIFVEYKARGFLTAIDDFGAGYAGLGLLAEMQPDYIKVDRALLTEIDRDNVRQAILRGIVETARALGIVVIAEGIERAEEVATVRAMGLTLFQGYFFARPALESLVPEERINWPVATAA